MQRFKSVRGGIFFLLAVGCVLAAVYLVRLEIKQSKPEDYVEMTAVQEVLNRDLSRNYPQTPKEVLKYYSEITQCYYNEEYTEEELQALSDKAMELYDDELAAFQTQKNYFADLKSEIKAFKEGGMRISSYSTSSSTDVFYFQEDGFEFARLYANYYVRTGAMTQKIEEVFVLRMDSNGHWRIYGWDTANKEAKEE